MRAVVLTCNDSIQMALCHKLAKVCDIAAIVVSRNIPARRKSITERLRLLRCRVEGRLAGKPFVDAWFQLQGKYHEQYAAFPAVPLVRVENVNALETLHVLEEQVPDLVIVSGTNLVGRKIIDLAWKRRGIINLHTGISPYVKGGPNCTNWCLAQRWFHLIGNTVMWLDPGIDTGVLIATEQTPLSGNESLLDLHWKVMEHAHEMYAAAVDALAEGKSLPKIPQNSVAAGHTFYTSDWNAAAMMRARRNFRRYYAPEYFGSAEMREQAQRLTLLPILR
jgi:methionyl-tRNA formyltransferase